MRSFFTLPVLLILLAIALLMPHFVYASDAGEGTPASSSSTTHQSDNQVNDLSLDFINLPLSSQTFREPASIASVKNNDEAIWQRFEQTIQSKKRADYVNGLSYIISGSIAIVGGYIGQGYSSDPLEKGVYTLFQTIGIASVGYGAYTWKIGSDDRFLYETISHVTGLDEKSKIAVVRSYFEQRKERERQERFIKMLTHGMIAAFNLYNATQQTNDSVKNGMFFIGGVNLLASVTYAF